MTEHRELAAEIGAAELDGFEVWDRTVHAPAGQAKKAAFVSVRVGGVIGMNRAAREMLGVTTAVKIIFDPERRRLGLVPTDETDPNSYYIGPSGWYPDSISAKKVFDYYGIDVTEGRRYENLEVVDGILVVDLSGPSSPCRAYPRYMQRTR